MRNIGTIYASSAQLSRYDAHSDKQEQERRNKGKAMFPNLVHRFVSGEDRYYLGDKFAIISRSGRVLWFEERGADTFSIPAPANMGGK